MKNDLVMTLAFRKKRDRDEKSLYKIARKSGTVQFQYKH